MIKAILFDVDGCLIDSFNSNLKFFQDLLQHFGYKGPTREEYNHLFHMPTIDVIKRCSGLNDLKKIQEIAEFGHSEKFPYETLPLPMSEGAPEVIQELAQKYKLGIITSRWKSGVFESEELKMYQNLFSVVMAYEDTKKHKPDPEPLLEAARKLKLTPSECVYIGDAPSDKSAGQAAGMRVIAYAQHNHERTDLDTHDFRDIPKLIQQMQE